MPDVAARAADPAARKTASPAAPGRHPGASRRGVGDKLPAVLGSRVERSHLEETGVTNRSQSGQALVVFTMMIVVFLGFCAVVLDAGRAYTERRHAQNAADAAALASGGLVTKLLMPCMAMPGCVDHVISGATEARVVRAAVTEAIGNSSLLGGYTTPPSVQVEYLRYGTTTYVQMRPDSFAYLPGDTAKVRVSVTLTWAPWFPMPSSDGHSLQRPQLSASASSVVMISGGGGVPNVDSGFWPVIRRATAIHPWTQDPPGVPYTFWSSGIVHSEDKAGSSWKGLVNLGLNSVRRDSQGNGYSPVASPRRQAFEAARNYQDATLWKSLPDMSCTENPSFSCGRDWSLKGNNPVGSLTYAVENFPRDPQNWFYYAHPTRLSLTNRWWELSCGGGIGDCQVPNESQFTKANGYELVGGPWSAAGDWVETYNGGGDVGANIFSELRRHIVNAGGECPYSHATFTKGNTIYEYGPCVTQVIYLWEGGQVYDKGTNRWIPWDGKEATPPDRVHVVDFWYFSFYLNLIDNLSSSEVQGFFTSYGEYGLPPGPSTKANSKHNYYFLVSE